jgi:SNF family Na+-dependent transporter
MAMMYSLREIIILGIGYASLATNCFLALYYNVLIAYCFYYLIASFQLVVPWSTCGNWWNTVLCTDQRTLANLSRTDLTLMKSKFFNW